MTGAIKLMLDLERQGVSFVWDGSRIRARGALERLTDDYRAALREVRDEFVSLVRWRELQDQAEAEFGHPAARLYPFLRLDLLVAPVVRTPQGEARVARVLVDGCDVVLEADLKLWEAECELSGRAKPLPPMFPVPVDDVHPPLSAPESSKIPAYKKAAGDLHSAAPDSETTKNHRVKARRQCSKR